MPTIPRQVMDLTGQTFGQLLVIAYGGRRKRNTYWTCKCLACGSVKDYPVGNLRKRLSTQCRGCPAKRKERKRLTAGYHSWRRIIRTGEVCQRWRSFDAFIADMGEPPQGKPFLMRIDDATPYKPGNCEWLSSSSTHTLTCGGRSMSFTDWAREIGLSREALYKRLAKMPVHEALTKTVRKR